MFRVWPSFYIDYGFGLNRKAIHMWRKGVATV